MWEKENNMERIILSDNINFSRLIYGMWRLTDDKDTSIEHIKKKISLCLDQGITTFDQADIYGDYSAEELFGEVIKVNKSVRKEIEIITKCDIIAPCGKYVDEPVKHYNSSRKHIIDSVEASLRNMNTDYIDLLLLHRPDPFMNADQTGKALDSLITSGKIRGVGVSNFKQWDWSLLQSRMDTPLLTNQIEFSLLNHTPLTNGELSFHYEKKIPIMAWSPLGGGKLFNYKTKLYFCLKDIAKKFNTDIATIAVAWILAHPSQILPVLGTNNLERIKKFSLAIDTKINRKTWYQLYSSALGHEVP